MRTHHQTVVAMKAVKSKHGKLNRFNTFCNSTMYNDRAALNMEELREQVATMAQLDAHSAPLPRRNTSGACSKGRRKGMV